MAQLIFEPSEEIRNFDGRKLVGREVTITLRHTNADVSLKKEAATDQYVVVASLWKEYAFLSCAGWCGKVLGKKSDTIKRVIRRCTLMQHANGGRSDHREADTYREFFNEAQRKKVESGRGMGLIGKVMGGAGDDDQADVVLHFDDFKLDSFAFEFRAPQEWQSEALREDNRFKFVDGFYEDADKAVDAFSQKSSDDMFGTRFFPVLVFPREMSKDKLDEITWRPKSTSDPVLVGGSIVIGTRCKSHEYDEVIRMTYAAGGRVPIGLEWNW